MTTVLDVAPGRIIVEADVLGGQPHIAGTRIPVHHIAVWYDRLGMHADDIATEYQLALSDIYAALAYYYAHQDGINAAIRAEDAVVGDMQQRYPSKLGQRRNG